MSSSGLSSPAVAVDGVVLVLPRALVFFLVDEAAEEAAGGVAMTAPARRAIEVAVAG